MGVNGLWTVLQPCARPTNLATLNRKRLAVDASIWIYQFLKAVRDKEGNALRNSHVVGFFRRICKLLWFGVRPVFVFDGGAPALKRQTITNRKRRREGRRDDAVRTAGKLLAVQMQRIAEEEGEKRRRMAELENTGVEMAADVVETEELPDESKLVYVDELGMSQQERQKSRKFYKQDAYHLPELGGSIDSMGRPEDPRIMSVEELEEYARQFHSGEDINLYDFSKIDFEGDFFKSLPPADRYNILNAARLRSRLRMGLSKEQLDDMFPDRMAFSRFQIERVKERNHLTQRLMKEAGMTGLDLTLGGSSRIAGERDREYILVKNEGAEGGWALGVVSKDKDRGEIHKPIDVDALDFQFQEKDEQDWEDEDDGDFEDIPIEGLNRLPKLKGTTAAQGSMDDTAGGFMVEDEDEESLFVAGPENVGADHVRTGGADEEEDLSRAIELSLRTQHGKGQASIDDDDDVEFEDVPAPEWTQKAATIEKPRPMTTTSGKLIAHIVNNRANAAIPKPKPAPSAPFQDSDSDDDLAAALSKVKKKKKAPAVKAKAEPIRPNVKNPFDGPLPFEKLNWKSSIFASQPKKADTSAAKNGPDAKKPQDDDMAGGFERQPGSDDEDPELTNDNTDDNKPRPLPPWMVQDEDDIRDSMRAQRELENEINEADREAAMAEEKRRRNENFIEIDSSDNESDVEILDQPPVVTGRDKKRDSAMAVPVSLATLTRISPPLPDPMEGVPQSRVTDSDIAAPLDPTMDVEEIRDEPDGDDSALPGEASSPEPDFEEVDIMQPPAEARDEQAVAASSTTTPDPIFEDVPEVESAQPEIQQEIAPEIMPDLTAVGTEEEDGIFNPETSEQILEDYDDEFSDPEDEQLLAQMAEEAEEHARFASQLTNKSAKDDQEAYERELKALRTQQKKDRRDADEVTQIMITECQALLRYFGIPYITAPMEAEAQCAELVDLGLVDGIVTDDSDIFLFGGTRVYKNMFNSNKFVECYLSSDLEKELSLGREQLISIAQLLGSDYTDGLPGVGPVTAVEILSEFPGRNGLEAFRDWWQDIQMNSRPKEADQKSTFRRKFRKSQATKLFLPPAFPSDAVFEAYLKPEVDSDPQAFQWGVPDVEGLRQFLMQTIGWSPERTDEILVPVVRDMNRRGVEGTQANITHFFDGAVGVGAKEAFAPRQKGKTSKRMAEAVNKLRSHAVAESIGGSGPVDAPAEEEEDGEAHDDITSGKSKRKRKTTRKVTDDDDGEEEEGEQGKGESVAAGTTRSRAKKVKASS